MWNSEMFYLHMIFYDKKSCCKLDQTHMILTLDDMNIIF